MNNFLYNLIYILLIVLIVVIFMLISTEDYEESINNRIRYCEMVRQGNWPDYSESYEQECL